MEDEQFWELTAGLENEYRSEQEAEAASIVAAANRERRFVDELRSCGPGDVVTLVTTDHAALRGRILNVGIDTLKLGEVTEATGIGRLRVVRVHDVRIDAVVRLVRER